MWEIVVVVVETFLVALIELSNRRKLKFMARVREDIINWPDEGIPSSNIIVT